MAVLALVGRIGPLEGHQQALDDTQPLLDQIVGRLSEEERNDRGERTPNHNVIDARRSQL